MTLTANNQNVLESLVAKAFISQVMNVQIVELIGAHHHETLFTPIASSEFYLLHLQHSLPKRLPRRTF